MKGQVCRLWSSRRYPVIWFLIQWRSMGDAPVVHIMEWKKLEFSLEPCLESRPA